MRFRLGIGSHKDMTQQAPSSGEKKEASDSGDAAVAGELDPESKPEESGSKDEVFFDSLAWLDSDCEDDFIIFEEDIVSSRGSTPNNQISRQSASQLKENLSTDTLPGTNSESSPTEGTKKLAQLLHQENQVEELASKQSLENINGETNGKSDFDKASDDHQLQKISYNGTPSKDLKHKEEESKRPCCLPRFGHTLSFKERRKAKSSPGQ